MHEADVVPHPSPAELLVSIISMNLLVLGAVEHCTANTHHGTYGGNLL
jgi:hypothetical protein